ncbi:MAG: PilN domain-containing protein [Planctomycetes bacterium]|nr:PilN domain-containing protein [Planctomycetota bacterium]
MTQVTVLSIGETALRVVAARLVADGIEIFQAASAPLPEDFVRRSPQERAAVLREALARCGGGNGRTILVLPRGSAVVRDFELPEGTPEEIQRMLRFQLERDLPLPIEEVRYSYVRFPGPDAKAHICVAAVPNASLEPLLEALDAAGCKVQGAYVSSFGTANLLPVAATLEHAAILVGFADGALEMSVVDGDRLTLSRSVPLRETSLDAVAAELSRTILSYGSRGGRAIKHVWVAGEGEGAEALVSGLGRRLGEAVGLLIFNGPIVRRPEVTIAMEMAAAAGVGVGALVGRRAMPNVLKTPAVPRKFRLKRVHQIILGAVLVLGTLFAASRWVLTARRAELEDLKTELRSLEPEALRIQKTHEKVRLVARWAQDRYSWIDTFAALQSAIDRSKIWLTNLTADETGFLRLQGKASDDDYVSAFIAHLQKDAVFRKVEREYTKPSQDKTGYAFDFAVRIQLAGLGATK